MKSASRVVRRNVYHFWASLSWLPQLRNHHCDRNRNRDRQTDTDDHRFLHFLGSICANNYPELALIVSLDFTPDHRLLFSCHLENFPGRCNFEQLDYRGLFNHCRKPFCAGSWRFPCRSVPEFHFSTRNIWRFMARRPFDTHVQWATTPLCMKCASSIDDGTKGLNASIMADHIITEMVRAIFRFCTFSHVCFWAGALTTLKFMYKMRN